MKKSSLDENQGAEKLLDQGIHIIARKEGDKGCTIFTIDEMIHLNAFGNIDVIDPTGCSEFYAATFVYVFLQGWTLKRMGLFANAVGSITATRRSAMEGITSLEEVELYLARNENIR